MRRALLRIEDPPDSGRLHTRRPFLFGIITFSLIAGIALNLLGDRGRTVRLFVDEVLELSMVIVRWVLRVLPAGVALLLMRSIGQAGWDVFVPLAKYMGAVLGGLTLHGGLVLPLLVWLLAKMPPWKFFQGALPALLTALSTSSSSATLPVTMRCVEQELKVPGYISRFCLPIGATVNMDGTALYEAVLPCSSRRRMVSPWTSLSKSLSF